MPRTHCHLTQVSGAMPQLEHKSIADGLRAARIRAGYKTAKDFAEDIGCLPQRWAKVESGQQSFMSLEESIRERAAIILKEAGGNFAVRYATEGQQGVHTRHMDPEELEHQLAARYGSRLRPVRCTLAQRKKRYFGRADCTLEDPDMQKRRTRRYVKEENF